MPNNILDRADLIELRNKLLGSQQQNSVVQSTRSPAAIINDFTEYKGSYIGGLTYPLKLNKNGGLAISRNDDRIREMVMEVLETKIGERVYRKFFGMPDVLFESISEDILSNLIRKQLRESIPDIAALDYDINIKATAEGDMVVIVSYNLQGASDPTTLYYSISL
jgi:phage baseplate assembly protein W